MKTTHKIAIVAVLAVLVAGAIALKNGQSPAKASSLEPLAPASAPAAETNRAVATATAKLPRMVDLGAGKCIPCKMMAPILAELKRDYAGRFGTEFIDVWENPDAGKPYGIRAIPTQIFFDVEGKELFRHEGFYGKEDILGKWKEFGVDVTAK